MSASSRRRLSRDMRMPGVSGTSSETSYAGRSALATGVESRKTIDGIAATTSCRYRAYSTADAPQMRPLGQAPFPISDKNVRPGHAICSFRRSIFRSRILFLLSVSVVRAGIGGSSKSSPSWLESSRSSCSRGNRSSPARVRSLLCDKSSMVALVPYTSATSSGIISRPFPAHDRWCSSGLYIKLSSLANLYSEPLSAVAAAAVAPKLPSSSAKVT
mmetsp:Transcript_3648/g.11430  ORF Transcript_3648/g.11430 Transcript_3648/m.11430 type:complete len:216 (-) Transcript_3648:333-980(-)